MKRDYERVSNQLESVIRVFNEAYENKQRITITKACNLAGVHVAWLYRILNNIDEYQISNEQLERYEEVRDRVFSEIIQEVDRIAHCDGEYDSEYSIDLSSNEETSSSQSNKDKDSGNRIARDSLRLKHEQWKLKNLLPKHFNEGSNNSNQTVVNGNQNNQYNISLDSFTPEQLRALASIKLLTQSNNNE